MSKEHEVLLEALLNKIRNTYNEGEWDRFSNILSYADVYNTIMELKQIIE